MTLPDAPKLMLMVLAGERLPEPETVDCTTPFETVTTRCAEVVPVLDSGPTMITAAITPPTASAPMPRLSGVS